MIPITSLTVQLIYGPEAPSQEVLTSQLLGDSFRILQLGDLLWFEHGGALHLLKVTSVTFSQDTQFLKKVLDVQTGEVVTGRPEPGSKARHIAKIQKQIDESFFKCYESRTAGLDDCAGINEQLGYLASTHWLKEIVLDPRKAESTPIPKFVRHFEGKGIFTEESYLDC